MFIAELAKAHNGSLENLNMVEAFFMQKKFEMSYFKLIQTKGSEILKIASTMPRKFQNNLIRSNKA